MITRNLTLSTSQKFREQGKSVFSGSRSFPMDDNCSTNIISLGVGEAHTIEMSSFFLMAANRPVSLEGTMVNLFISDGSNNTITFTGLYPETTLEISHVHNA